MSLRVLIVEDEFFIALDLQDQVQSLGHMVTAAARDVEGSKRAERPDAVLMDLRLAGATCGIDASWWLQQALGVRGFFISGNLEEPTRAYLSAFEPIAFIDKPILRYQPERAFRTAAPPRK